MVCNLYPNKICPTRGSWLSAPRRASARTLTLEQWNNEQRNITSPPLTAMGDYHSYFSRSMDIFHPPIHEGKWALSWRRSKLWLGNAGRCINRKRNRERNQRIPHIPAHLLDFRNLTLGHTRNRSDPGSNCEMKTKVPTSRSTLRDTRCPESELHVQRQKILKNYGEISTATVTEKK